MKATKMTKGWKHFPLGCTMNSLVIRAILATSVCYVLASEYDNDVVDLTGVDFAAWLESHPVALVMFYSPKNSSSRNLLPMFKEFVAVFKEHDEEAVLAKLDCSGKSAGTCNEYAISGLPTFAVFSDGHLWKSDYEAEKTILEDHWTERMTAGDAKFDSTAATPLLKGVAQLAALLEERNDVVIDLSGVDVVRWLERHPVALVLFCDPWNTDCRRLLPYYQRTAGTVMKRFSEVMMAKVDCTVSEMKDICDEHAYSGFPTFTVFRDGQPWDSGEIEDLMKPMMEKMFSGIARQNEPFAKIANAEFAGPLRSALVRLTSAMYFHASRPNDEL